MSCTVRVVDWWFPKVIRMMQPSTMQPVAAHTRLVACNFSPVSPKGIWAGLCYPSTGRQPGEPETSLATITPRLYGQYVWAVQLEDQTE